MPLEFQLSSSLPPSELNFSLSAATLKQFKSVHVEAQTRLQVYAHYRPLPNKSPAVTSTASERDLDLSAIASGKEAEAVTVRERLSITCRLVKDFQQEIQLLARRHAPQLSLLVEGNLNTAGANKYSSSAGILYVVRETPPALPANESGNGGGSSILGADATFGPDGGGIPVGGASAGGVEVDGQPSRLVTVRNLRPGRRVVIAVVNVSMYFSVTPVANSSSESGVGCSNCDGAITAACTDAGNSGGDGRCNVGFRGWGQGVGMGAVADGIELFDVPAGESLTLSVTPRLDKLRSGKGLALLANEQSLEEHFMVYNRRHPTEQYRISLKLTAGDLRTFFLSPGSKNAHAFWTLEENITVFLKAYQCMWMDFLELEPQLKAMLGEVGRGGSAFKESGPLVFHRALDGLDAAMIAAGEPRKKISRNIASKSFAGASTDERSTSQSGRVSDRGVGDGCRDVPGRLSPGGARSLAALTAVAQHSSRLIFEMFYITDELLFYALKHEGHVGEFALRLANLVYSVVFRHEVFAAFAALPVEERDTEGAPAFLRRWGAHLNHFLGYFPVPHAKPAILPLVELRRSLAPCFAALPAGGKGREREGAPTRDETPGVSTP